MLEGVHGVPTGRGPESPKDAPPISQEGAGTKRTTDRLKVGQRRAGLGRKHEATKRETKRVNHDDEKVVWKESIESTRVEPEVARQINRLDRPQKRRRVEEDDNWERSTAEIVPDEWDTGWEGNASDVDLLEGLTDDFDKLGDSDPFAEEDSRERAARLRNEERLRKANEEDVARLGKHLPTEPDWLFPGPWIGPDDYFQPPEDWVEDLKAISSEEERVPDNPTIKFSTDDAALSANTKILEDCEFDLDSLLARQPGTTVTPGSEFRRVEIIRRVLKNHPNLDFLEDIFTSGMEYKFKEEISEKDRVRELELQLDRGNHPSAMVDQDRLKALLKKDVEHGFCLPVRSHLVRRIKHAMVQPCGMVEQYSLQADGSRALKRRLTHDLTFGISGNSISVNSRVDMSKYPEMVYGWCLSRIIHYAVCLRHEYPRKRIWAQKFDYSDAYRRIAHSGRAAAQTILVLEGIAYIMLRLAFGGSPNPPGFCGFSEALTDLGNELSCAKVDPREFDIPTVEEEHLVPVEHPGGDDVPFGDAILPAFQVPVSLTSRKDCFIDDIINVFLDSDENLSRECHIIPLAIQLLSRPHAGSDKEPIKRRPLLGPDKLKAEGRPAEVQVVLGWELDFRRLTVALPADKYIAWADDLKLVILHRRTTFGELDSIVGRLNHAAYVIPLSRHYLNPFRSRLKKKKSKNQTIRLTDTEVDLAKTWQEFLRVAREGISMNLLTVRSPTLVGWSDSCPYGLGGFLQGGRAWRLRIPEAAAFRGDDTCNNVLEFLGLAINIFLMIEDARTRGEKHPCLMPLGDNTSGIGWIFRSGRIERRSKYFEAVQYIARRVAEATMRAGAQLCPQHIEGSRNDVADTLSYSGMDRGRANSLTFDSPTDDELTQRIRNVHHQIVPKSFEISDLTGETASFACAALRIIELSWRPVKKEVTRTSIARGDDGPRFWQGSESEMLSSMRCHGGTKTSSSEVSSPPFESQSLTGRDELLASVRGRWLRRLSGTPQAFWARRFGGITSQARCTSRSRPSGSLHLSSPSDSS